ncbi:MAG: LysM peptidoglycan-binding domain-containing protein [Fibrobacterota bacterium]
MMRRLAFPMLSLLLLLALTACTPTVQPGSRSTEKTIDSLEQSFQNRGDELTKGIYFIEEPLRLVLISDTLISTAEDLAADGRYDEGHRIVKLAYEILERNREGIEQEALLDSLRLFDRIGSFYAHLTPPVYLDSVPDKISPVVTKIQLEAIMSSLDTMNMDTTILPKDCKTVHYNISIEQNSRVDKALIALLSVRRKSYMNTLLGKAHRYRPFMDSIFSEYGLPTDLTYLPLLESAFNMKAYSRAHASGLWQFIPSTGRIFNLRQSYWIDERRDPLKSTEAAAQYLTRLYGLFEDWYLALASYNCGEGRVGRQIKRDDSHSYWDLSLPRETMNYVPLYIAYQIIAKNPRCFGFTPDTSLPVYQFDVAEVSDCIDMRKVAKGIDVPYDTLRSMNPHIIKWCTPPDMKKVNLYLPPGTKDAYLEYYNNLTAADKVKWYRYRIQRGDNLGTIADRFNTSVRAIKSINSMRSSRIIAGRYIFIPIAADADVEKMVHTQEKRTESRKNSMTYRVSKGETAYRIAETFGISLQELKSANSGRNLSRLSIGEKIRIPVEETEQQTVPMGQRRIYTVTAGETAYHIARSFDVPLSRLKEWNPGKDLSRLSIGDKLILHTDETLEAAYERKQTPDSTVSAPQRASETAAPPSSADTAGGDQANYTVRSGETAYSIGQRFGHSVGDMEKWNPHKDLSRLSIGDTLLLPREDLTTQDRPTSETPKGTKKTHIVRSGQTLYSIARKHGVNLSNLLRWNNKDVSVPVIHVGDTLVYYSTKAEPRSTEKKKNTDRGIIKYRARKGDTYYSIARTFSVSLEKLLSLNSLSKTDPLYPGDMILIPGKAKSGAPAQERETIQYRVRSGDNLWKIARTFNTAVNDICIANNITKETPLYPGDIITIPQQD